MIPLKNVLLINGASSGVTGIGLIAFARFLSNLFQVPLPIVFIGTGAFLIGFAALVLLEAFRSQLRIKQVQFIIALDILWVVASSLIVLVMPTKISAIGNFMIIAVALWVAAMAYFQAKGLKQITLQKNKL